jgi:hypothetical protein
MRRALVISLIINIVLLRLAMRQRLHPRIPSRTPRLEISGFAARAVRVASGSSTHGASATLWNTIDSLDPAKFIANLRALDCPEATIRDIIVLRLGRKYRNELLQEEAAAARSWDYTRARKDWAERIQRQNELRDQMQTELERLLGQGWNSIAKSAVGWPSPPADIYSFVSEEKRQQIRELEREHNRLKANLERQQSRTPLSPWAMTDNTPMIELEREHQADLARVLSPQEMKEYLYRFSPAANYVRDNLPAARDESEFRTIVDVAQQFELWNQPAMSVSERYGLPPEPGIDADASADPAAADYTARKAAFVTRLKEVLGADRVAQQKAEEEARAEEKSKQEQAAAQESERDQISAVAASVGVPAEDANRFFEQLKKLQPELRPKFEQLEKDVKGREGTDEEKGKAMKTAIKAELERIATEFMGDKAHAFVEKMDKEAP